MFPCFITVNNKLLFFLEHIVLRNSDLNIMGCDMKDMLVKLDMRDAPVRYEFMSPTYLYSQFSIKI